VPTANQLQKLKTKPEARRGRFATDPRRRYAFGDDHYRRRINSELVARFDSLARRRDSLLRCSR
jgi:hypothetical protein